MDMKETIILDCEDSNLIEQAIFILKAPVSQSGPAKRSDAVEEAQRIVTEYRKQNEYSFLKSVERKRKERKMKRLKHILVPLLFLAAALGGVAVSFASNL